MTLPGATAPGNGKGVEIEMNRNDQKVRMERKRGGVERKSGK